MAAWLDPADLRVGLGCMRLSTDADRDDTRAAATIAAAAGAGVVVFDTAHAYGADDSDAGHNERVLAAALRAAGAADRARIVTKGGMTRPSGRWQPDGRAGTIRRHCEESLVALDGMPIDLYLIHAPDPRVPWRTTMRALGRLVDAGLVRRVGVCNVNRRLLEEAVDLAPVSAVQIAISIFDDAAVRGGVVDRCTDLGIAVLAHSPLGGPRRSNRLERNPTIADIASRSGVPAAEVALAGLLDLAPDVVALPGARRPDTARSAAHAAQLQLSESDRVRLREAYAATRPSRPTAPHRQPSGGEVVAVMGIPGAGKTDLADVYARRGFLRLNRDLRGGTLKELAAGLESSLRDGALNVVLDNTYLSRAARSHVIDAAAQHGRLSRCIWLDTPVDQAQVNLVMRMLDRFGELPSPEALLAVARAEPGLMLPTSFLRTVRELEPPTTDEGWDALDRVSFSRRQDELTAGAVFVAAEVLTQPDWRNAVQHTDPSRPHLVFDWREGGAPPDLDDVAASLRAVVDGLVDVAVCPHPGGPPSCWCRPPLPGLPLAFAHRHQLNPARSVLVGLTATHRRLSAAIGARYVQAS